jgi:hypothetical protein
VGSSSDAGRRSTAVIGFSAGFHHPAPLEACSIVEQKLLTIRQAHLMDTNERLSLEKQ